MDATTIAFIGVAVGLTAVVIVAVVIFAVKLSKDRGHGVEDGAKDNRLSLDPEQDLEL